ncbi:MAG: hypothetical protein Q8K32_01720 [Archangium sp.]|nr:hypothetical protein [Archangium sp.]
MRLHFVVLAMIVSGCGGGLERVAFATDQLSYRPGGRVGLTLVNTSASNLGINLCLSRVVSEDGKTAGPADGESCVLEPQTLEPGARVDARKTLSPSIAAGMWRYETTIRLANGAGETVLTAPFAVGSN